MEKIKIIIKNSIAEIKEYHTTETEYEEILISTPFNNKLDFHYCSNILFKLKRTLKSNFEMPLKRAILKNNEVAFVDFINGYINLTMKPIFFATMIEEILNNSVLPNIGKQNKVNVEYCSINPTGFLHIGHARNAILGDAIANILSSINYCVTKEYYINDAGNQIKLLAQSVKARAEGKDIPEGGYKGEEIKDIAKLININDSDEKIEETAVNYFLSEIKKDLNAINIYHDSWIHEKEIIKSGYIEKAIALLKEKGYVYEGIRDDKKATKGKIDNKPLLLLKTTNFGDDEDRPLTKSDGSWTYLAPDIGYHLNKIERGAKYLICILGADHDSYAKRIKIATKLLKEDIEHKTPICQMVSFELDGKNVKFSKRAGNAIRVSDFIQEVHPDILRFMILAKSPGTPFIFDYENAINISMKNPLFYVQYAHARGCSILRNYDHEIKPIKGYEKTFEIKEFQEMIITLSAFSNILEESAKQLAPHIMINYAQKLAESMHKLWQIGNVDNTKRIILDNVIETSARINIIQAFLKIFKKTLEIIGINAPEKME